MKKNVTTKKTVKTIALTMAAITAVAPVNAFASEATPENNEETVASETLNGSEFDEVQEAENKAADATKKTANIENDIFDEVSDNRSEVSEGVATATDALKEEATDEKDNNDAESLIDETQVSIVDAKNNDEAVKSNMDKLKDMSDAAEKTAEELEKKVNSLSKEFDSYMSAIENAATPEEANEAYNNLLTLINDAKNSVDSSKNNYVSLSEAYDTYVAAVSEAETKYNNAKTKAESDVMAALSNLEAVKNKIGVLDEEVEAARAAYVDAVTKANSDVTTAKEEYEKAKAELESKKISLEECNSNKSAAEKLIASYEEKIAQANTISREETSKKISYEEAYNDAMKSAAEIARLEKKIQDKGVAGDYASLDTLFYSIMENYYVPYVLGGKFVKVNNSFTKFGNEKGVENSGSINNYYEFDVVYEDGKKETLRYNYRLDETGTKLIIFEKSKYPMEEMEAYYTTDNILVATSYDEFKKLVSSGEIIKKGDTYYYKGELVSETSHEAKHEIEKLTTSYKYIDGMYVEQLKAQQTTYRSEIEFAFETVYDAVIDLTGYTFDKGVKVYDAFKYISAKFDNFYKENGYYNLNGNGFKPNEFSVGLVNGQTVIKSGVISLKYAKLNEDESTKNNPVITTDTVKGGADPHLYEDADSAKNAARSDTYYKSLDKVSKNKKTAIEVLKSYFGENYYKSCSATMVDDALGDANVVSVKDLTNDEIDAYTYTYSDVINEKRYNTVTVEKKRVYTPESGKYVKKNTPDNEQNANFFNNTDCFYEYEDEEFRNWVSQGKTLKEKIEECSEKISEAEKNATKYTGLKENQERNLDTIKTAITEHNDNILDLTSQVSDLYSKWQELIDNSKKVEGSYNYEKLLNYIAEADFNTTDSIYKINELINAIKKLSKHDIDIDLAISDVAVKSANIKVNEATDSYSKIVDKIELARTTRDNKIASLTPAPVAPVTPAPVAPVTPAPVQAAPATPVQATPAAPVNTEVIPEAEVPLASIDNEEIIENTTDENKEDAQLATIEDEDVALAAIPEEDNKKMSWWWLLILALASAVGYGVYKHNDKKNTINNDK